MAFILGTYLKCDIGLLSNFSNFENRTNFTAIEFKNYVEYLKIQCLESLAIGRVGLFTFIISGRVGLIAYILMYATLMKLSISDCTLLYHKAITIFELVHMFIMIQHGILQVCLNQIDTYSWIWQFWNYQLGDGWVFGDGIKLAVSTLTAFLTLERCIAVTFPLFFIKINKKWVAFLAISLSIFIGSAHLWAILAQEILHDPLKNQYYFAPTQFSGTAFYSFILDLIFVSRIVLGCLTLSFCFITAVTLRLRARTVWLINSNAHHGGRLLRKASILAYILGISIFFDHFAWVSNKLLKRSLDPGKYDNAVLALSYEESIKRINHARLLSIVELAQRITGQVVHCWEIFSVSDF